MMTTRRTLFVFGALLAVSVLLAPQSAFAQVTAVMVDQVTDTTIELDWTSPATAVDEIHVGWIKENEDGDATVPVNPEPGMIMRDIDPSVTTYTITGLEPETEYVVGVRTQVTGSAPVAWAEPTANPTTRAAPDAPPAPDAPDAPVISAMPAWNWMIMVSWDAVDDATMYKVEWRKETESYGASDRMVEVTGMSYSISGAAADTVYMVRVTAANGDVYGMMSDEVTVRMPTLITEKPTVTITPGNAELKVDWTAVTGGTQYCVEWGTGDRIVPTGNTYCSGRGTHRTSGERSYKITMYDGAALKNGTEYVVQVTGNNAAGAGPVSDRVKGTPTTVGNSAPGAPAISLMSGDSMLMVSWDAVDGATKYKVQWSSEAQSFGAADRTAEVMDGTSYDITGLENGMEYKVRVAAGNKDHGYGDWSGEARAMPMMPTPALPVFGVLALGAGLVAAGRRRLRARREPRLLKA